MTWAALSIVAALAATPSRVLVLCGHSPDVSPEVLALAQREAEALFVRDGIQIEWMDSLENEMTGAPALVVLFSRAATYPIRVSPDALGVTLLDARGVPRQVSVLFLDRLKKVAGRPIAEYMGRALGRAMAHEIGHGLLRKNDHSRSGLLREAIGWRSWTARSREPFYLAPSDALAIRGHLVDGSP